MEYRGVTLTSEPANMTMAEATRLFALGIPFIITLEPGDWTRYHMLIVPSKRIVAGFDSSTGLVLHGNFGYGPEYRAMVVRMRGGHPENAAMVSDDMHVDEFRRIAPDNNHTAAVLAWWFQEFWRAIG